MFPEVRAQPLAQCVFVDSDTRTTRRCARSLPHAALLSGRLLVADLHAHVPLDAELRPAEHVGVLHRVGLALQHHRQLLREAGAVRPERAQLHLPHHLRHGGELALTDGTLVSAAAAATASLPLCARLRHARRVASLKRAGREALPACRFRTCHAAMCIMPRARRCSHAALRRFFATSAVRARRGGWWTLTAPAWCPSSCTSRTCWDRTAGPSTGSASARTHALLRCTPPRVCANRNAASCDTHARRVLTAAVTLRHRLLADSCARVLAGIAGRCVDLHIQQRQLQPVVRHGRQRRRQQGAGLPPLPLQRAHTHQDRLAGAHRCASRCCFVCRTPRTNKRRLHAGEHT